MKIRFENGYELSVKLVNRNGFKNLHKKQVCKFYCPEEKYFKNELTEQEAAESVVCRYLMYDQSRDIFTSSDTEPKDNSKVIGKVCILEKDLELHFPEENKPIEEAKVIIQNELFHFSRWFEDRIYVIKIKDITGETVKSYNSYRGDLDSAIKKAEKKFSKFLIALEETQRLIEIVFLSRDRAKEVLGLIKSENINGAFKLLKYFENDRINQKFQNIKTVRKKYEKTYDIEGYLIGTNDKNIGFYKKVWTP